MAVVNKNRQKTTTLFYSNHMQENIRTIIWEQPGAAEHMTLTMTTTQSELQWTMEQFMQYKDIEVQVSPLPE